MIGDYGREERDAVFIVARTVEGSLRVLLQVDSRSQTRTARVVARPVACKERKMRVRRVAEVSVRRVIFRVLEGSVRGQSNSNRTHNRFGMCVSDFS